MAQRQRKGQPAQGRSGGNTAFYIVLGVIAVGGILALAYAVTGGGGGQAATEPVDLDAPDARALYEQATPMRQGPETAPVRVIEFADYQCPACATFAQSMKPVIEDRFLEGGQVQFIYYDFPLTQIHPHAFVAARAARCAGDQTLPDAEGENAAYWRYHDKLFQEQSSWSPRSSVVGAFVDYAREIGLDAREFERCLRSDRHAEVVTANLRLGEQLRITGTPTVLVNNRRVPNRTADIVEAIEQALPGQEDG